MKLTQEQEKAVDLFNTTADMKVIAYAGAGKTSTLIAMAQSDETSGALYLAFNKRIAEEAGAKFPYNTRASTAHSLAFRAIRGRFQDMEKLTKNPRMLDARIKPFVEGDGSGAKSRDIVARTLRRFMQSDDAVLAEQHAPYLEGMGFVDSPAGYLARLRAMATRTAAEIWGRMCDPRDQLPLGHDGYLKLWAMSKPDIPTDTLFVDEAQDLNPVLIGVVRRQGCQVVCVGDPHQQIYEWRGAVDALGKDGLAGHSCRLTQSFRFGPEIAFQADRMLRLLGETEPLQGMGQAGEVEFYQQGESGSTDAILCRSNAGVIQCAADAFDTGEPVYIPGGVNDLLDWVRDGELLQMGQDARPGELMGFKSWQEVKDFSGSVDGSHLGVFVRLMEDYGPRELNRILANVLKEPRDDALTVSTTHKAKGLEWDRVLVHDDFMTGTETRDGQRPKIQASQVRLFYVAMTRAKRRLVLPLGILSAYETAEITGLK